MIDWLIDWFITGSSWRDKLPPGISFRRANDVDDDDDVQDLDDDDVQDVDNDDVQDVDDDDVQDVEDEEGEYNEDVEDEYMEEEEESAEEGPLKQFTARLPPGISMTILQQVKI